MVNEQTDLLSYKLRNRTGRIYGILKNFSATGNIDHIRQLRVALAEADAVAKEMIVSETQQVLTPTTYTHATATQ